MDSHINPIPTEYRGHRFRSRLEAKWACLFDNCGWPWEYEPIDLKGYIPDFILTFKEPILVECKPALEFRELDQYCGKIQASGWRGEVLIVGAKIFNQNGLAIIGELWERPMNCWAPGPCVLQTCLRCKVTSLYNDDGSYRCRVSQCHEGNTYNNPWSYQNARELFADCSGVVQYNI